MNSKTKRLLIGIVSLLLSLLIAFVIAPLFLKMSEEKVQVLRFRSDAAAGSEIAPSMFELQSVLRSSLRGGELSDSSGITGMVLSVPRAAGDFLTRSMLQLEPLYGDEHLMSLAEDEVAFSISIQSLAAGLSDQIRAGDVISIYAHQDQKEEALHDPLLWYVRVLTVSDRAGREVRFDAKEESDQYQSAAVMLAVSFEQAKKLAALEYVAQLHLALVERKDAARKEALLVEQKKYILEYQEKVKKETNGEKGDAVAPEETP